ncbi:hypothetical protein [Microbacterium lacus]|uniref:hypothetical protein n=1 Tax=Microbacterium lacus TaxID=415217 RepID=UPI000C2C2B83|nr:hypothetical protein [Microbacterium lacus]
MAQDPLRITLDTLRSEREGAERDAIELDQKLKAVGQRLTHLRGAIENIEALLGVPSAEDEAVLADNFEDDEPAGATVREFDFTNVPDAPVSSKDDDVDPDFGPVTPAVRKRVPSTDWVAEVVERIGQPADRDDIYKAFGHYKGFPEAWTNPRNSVNNALGRAVERGMVRKLKENLFAPLGYKPIGSDSDDREES